MILIPQSKGTQRCRCFVKCSKVLFITLTVTFYARWVRSVFVSRPLQFEHEKTSKIFIGYLSAPKNFEKREKIRKTCYHDGMKFFIGVPFGKLSKAQGKVKPDHIQEIERNLLAEIEEYKDIELLAMGDHYAFLGMKTFHVFQYGANLNADFVLKIDDDKCANMPAIEAVLKAEGTRQLYLGYSQFKGDEYEIMKGANGQVAKYMSGPAYGLSSDLIEDIFFEMKHQALLWATYGSSSEDANMGKWVQMWEQRHQKKSKFVVKREIQFALEGVKDHDP